MKNMLTEDVKYLIDAPLYFPSVSILLPFDPKMSGSHELQRQLHLAYAKVKQQLLASYMPDKAEVVLKRLNKIIETLNYTTYKKSICIFVSPVAQKILYLSIQVEPQIIIDESFQVKDILRSKKQDAQFLLLSLSGKACRLYLGDNSGKLIKMVCNMPADFAKHEIATPERVSNFTDPAAIKETRLNRFLHKIDNSLTLILESYPLPLIVTGTKKLLGYFKNISHHSKHVITFVNGSYIDASEEYLAKMIQPHVRNWNELKETDLLLQIDKAKSSGKLITGIERVYSASTRSNNRLLIVEERYSFAADRISAGSIRAHDVSSSLYIKDAVDDVIENVLRSGGDVEFVSSGMLENYERIALIKYFATGIDY